MDTVTSKQDMILAYRVITGACSSGTRDFVKSTEIPNELDVKTAMAITKGRYGNEQFREFFGR